MTKSQNVIEECVGSNFFQVLDESMNDPVQHQSNDQVIVSSVNAGLNGNSKVILEGGILKKEFGDSENKKKKKKKRNKRKIISAEYLGFYAYKKDEMLATNLDNDHFDSLMEEKARANKQEVMEINELNIKKNLKEDIYEYNEEVCDDIFYEEENYHFHYDFKYNKTLRRKQKDIDNMKPYTLSSKNKELHNIKLLSDHAKYYLHNYRNQVDEFLCPKKKIK